MRRSLLHAIISTSMLAATGCSVLAAGADPSHGAAWGLDSEAASNARPMSGRDAPPRAESTSRPDAGIGHVSKADAPLVARAQPVDTIDLAPGAVLDVWLYDGRSAPPIATSERSLGTTIVQGDFFRYNSVNAIPDLRGLWGQPLLLKWSGFLKINRSGEHVLMFTLSKERGWGAMEVETLVKVNGESVFERKVRVFQTNTISETGSRAISLDEGYHRLEVWLAAENRLSLPPSTQLGTYITLREPGVRTGEPLSSSRIRYRVQ